MNISKLEELEKFFKKTDVFSFYGLGAIGTMMLSYLDTYGLSNKLQFFILTAKEEGTNSFFGKPVRSVEELSKEEKFVPVFIATRQPLHDEILKTLAMHGMKDSVTVSDEVFLEVENRVQLKLLGETNEHAVVHALSELQDTSSEADVLLLSPPYWDVYSPFSAVPSLMGKLKENGISAIQADIGIECFHYLLSHIWRPIALYFMSDAFYRKVCEYKNNPYRTYEEYFSALWFFQEREFPVNRVKKLYTSMNDIQCGVINCFYQRLLSLDNKSINFNTLQSIHDEIKNNSWNIFYSALSSERIKSVLKGIPRIVGISATGLNQFLPACKLASLIKAAKPDAKLILGGSCADLFMESEYPFKKEIYDFFDYVIVGEGETALCKICDCLKRGSSVGKDIPNVAHLDGENRVSYATQILEDVETLPLADYTGLDLSRYMAPRPILPYQASRGCHYGQCAFCNHNEKYRHNYRMKSSKKVVYELVQLSMKYCIKDIQFVDEAIRPDHFEGIVETMECMESFHDICWFYYSRVSRRYHPELLCRAYQCGCRMVMFGIETLNQRLLSFIKKGIQADTSRYCLKLFYECGIKTYAWLMGNLPSETVGELRADIVDVEKTIPYIDAAAVGAFRLEINTDMYKNPQQYNILSVNLACPEKFSSHYNNELIDKEAMLRSISNEYMSMLYKYFFYRDRYDVYFRAEK